MALSVMNSLIKPKKVYFAYIIHAARVYMNIQTSEIFCVERLNKLIKR